MKTLIILFTTIFIATHVQAQEIKVKDFEDQKKRSIEVGFFSPLSGNLTLGYEQYLKNNMSIEGNLGIIGIGHSREDQLGAFLKAGIKFKLNPDYTVDGMKATHTLQGGYLKPEIAYSVYSVKEPVYAEPYNPEFEYTTATSHNVSFQLVYGRQWVLGELLVVDPYVGLGYGFGTGSQGYAYGFAYIPGFGLATSGGLRIGILLK